MVRYVGRQYTADELWAFYSDYADVHSSEEAALQPLSARIRAFDVPVLAGAIFTASRLRDVASALQEVLTQRLPDIAWDILDRFRVGRITKYAIIHHVAQAPVDESTQQQMVLELFGFLTEVNGQQLGRGWHQRLRPTEQAVNDDAEIGEMVFRLQRGTYANTRTPGVGVPFYM